MEPSFYRIVKVVSHIRDFRRHSQRNYEHLNPRIMMIPEDTSALHDDESCSWSSDTHRLLKAVNDESLETLEAVLAKGGVLVNAHGGVFHETPLHKAAQRGWVAGLKLLLSHGASVNAANQYGQTPLHYASASKTSEGINSILGSGISPSTLDHKDNRGHTPLHDAAEVGHKEGVALLLKAGASVDLRDKKEQTPLHKAARALSIPTMLILLNHGADLGARDKTGESVLNYVLRHIPGGMETLLDYCLTPNAEKLSSKKLEVSFNFVPLAGSSPHNQMKTLNEVVVYGQPKLLLHPVCEAYLLLKWYHVKKLFFIEVIFYFVHTILATVFIMNKFVWHCTEIVNLTTLCSEASNVTDKDVNYYSSSCNSNNTEKLECAFPPVIFSVFEIIIIMMATVILLKQVLTIIQGVRSWLFSIWHVLHGVIVILILIVIPGKFSMWQQHLATVTLLLLWVQCMLHIGRFPGCGIYVAMFTRVAKVFVRMFLIFFCLLLAFSLSFYVSFAGHDPKDLAEGKRRESSVFDNPLIGFIKTLTMMIGELDFDLEFVEDLGYVVVTSHLIYLSFVILVSIILSNLLVALAVNDVQGLRNSAHLERLIKQMELVYQMERTFYSLTTITHFTKCWWFNEKLRIFVHNFSFTKIFVQPYHPEKGNNLILLERGIMKEINLPQNHVATLMERLRFLEEENISSNRKVSVRKNRLARSEYSTFSCGQDEVGELLKKIERNLLEAISEKMDDTTDTLNSLFTRLKSLEAAFVCGNGDYETPRNESASRTNGSSQWKNASHHVLQPTFRKHPYSFSNRLLGKEQGSCRYSQPTLRQHQRFNDQRRFMSQSYSTKPKHAAATPELPPLSHLRDGQPWKEEEPAPSMLQESQISPLLETRPKVQFEMASQEILAPLPLNGVKIANAEDSETNEIQQV